MSKILFRNMALLDTVAGEFLSDHEVLVENDTIVRVSEGRSHPRGAKVIDLGGRTLMPGLIDCHIHILAPGRGGRPTAYPDRLPSYYDLHSGTVLREMLMRGFTCLRDAGGADLGHRQAVDEGLVEGPRMFVSGRPLTQTGGHADRRALGDQIDPCGCAQLQTRCRIVDGVPAMLHAVRDELRLGADQIKVMAGGGVSSEADPLDHLQFTADELAAVVDEARRSHTYVLAHVYTDEGIRRCVEAGVRTIEHGNFLSEDTARMMAEAGAILVPTLIANLVLAERGEALGLTPMQMQKLDRVLESGSRSLEIAAAAGVKMALGTDIITRSTADQPREITVRAEVLRPADIIRSATVIGAEVVRMEGRLGVVAEGALADLLVIDGDPLADLGLLQDEGAHIAAIMKGGRFYKNRLDGWSGDPPLQP